MKALLLMSCATCALFATAGAAFAQQPSMIEEVIVTATKRNEGL